jgi:hypothetical protein
VLGSETAGRSRTLHLPRRLWLSGDLERGCRGRCVEWEVVVVDSLRRGGEACQLGT